MPHDSGVSMIKSVIFDIDNTLYSYDLAHETAFAALKSYAEKELCIAPDEFKELHTEANEAIKQRLGNCAAIHNRLIRYQYIIEKLHKPLIHAQRMDDLYWNTLIGCSVPSPQAADVMRELKASGISLGICTDMTSYLQFTKLDKLGLIEYVDFIVSSEEAGAEKPDRAIFELAVSKSGFNPEECLYVGDSYKKDVLGAHSCGMPAAWYTYHIAGKLSETDISEKPLLPAMTYDPEYSVSGGPAMYHITGLTELLKIVK